MLRKIPYKMRLAILVANELLWSIVSKVIIARITADRMLARKLALQSRPH